MPLAQRLAVWFDCVFGVDPKHQTTERDFVGRKIPDLLTDLHGRNSTRVKLAPRNEKDLPTSQPSSQTNSWFPGADGHAGRTQGAQAPPREGPRTPCYLDTAQAAGLTSVRGRSSFAAADRLHRSAEFLRLQRNGVRFQSPHFVVYGGISRRPADAFAPGRDSIAQNRQRGGAQPGKAAGAGNF